MTDEAYKYILDREKVEVDASNFYKEQFDLLKKLVDYGTNLIPRCFSKTNRNIEDIILLPVLLKHAVSMLDALELLFSKAAIFAATLQARSLFESILYVEWILKKDTHIRASYYYVWSLRQELEWAKKTVSGYDEHEKFFSILKKFDNFIIERLNESESVYKKNLDACISLLQSTPYKDINDKFERLKQKNKNKKEVAWFKPTGPSSIADLAERLNRRAEYEIFYTQYSKIIHGTSLTEQITIKKNHLYLNKIRSLKNADILLINTASIIIELYLEILKYYRPSELENFRKKYLEDWGKKIKSIKSVKEVYSDVNII